MQSNGTVDLDRIEELLPGQVNRYADYIATQCVFHDDDRPSLLIHADTYKCLGCGTFGRTSKLLEKLTGNIVKSQPKHYFNNPFTQWVKHDTLSIALKLAWENLKKNPSHYMTTRGIKPAEQIKYGLGMRDGWITFPIRNPTNDKIIGAVARAGEENNTNAKYVTPNGQNPNLLYIPNIKLLKTSRSIYITFGIIDALTLALYGFPAASTTNGKRIDPAALEEYRKLILFVPDKGEEMEAILIASKLGWRGKVITVNYPDGSKDINDVHMNYPSLLLKMMERRKS